MILVYDYTDIYEFDKKIVFSQDNFFNEVLKEKYKILIINFDFLKDFLEIKKFFNGYVIFIYHIYGFVEYKKALEIGDFFYTYDEIWKVNLRIEYLKKKLKIKDIYKIKDFIIDIKNYIIFKDNKPIKISKAEFEILKTLLLNQNKYISKEFILNSIDEINSYDTIKVLISKLRNLGFNIETIKNLGYKIKEE
ncbi:winged helix-turn-helix transcriptional regulator [Caminibacter mediatlanticus TB-2]|uniref:Winged helix-turn-helix transcriptional regulator n=1 Tax=Caminibacter mediatlanticus TB-2 TaxID=391592 RepID=A0AAI9AGJ6_9BACT|nr:winged helix-turn-helix domain-containing protein [Caminibacter mediatlanticus]EDM23094.1 hypothetical protein CMTB2_00184 [Caminibacter mediatlanticus TB-2]QCT94539.1 winged helix-turn-helix transcriptional regulator [Caminibacter mediatlanticus TB-2]